MRQVTSSKTSILRFNLIVKKKKRGGWVRLMSHLF